MIRMSEVRGCLAWEVGNINIEDTNLIEISTLMKYGFSLLPHWDFMRFMGSEGTLFWHSKIG